MQLKYCTILSKPNTSASQAATKDALVELSVSPRFYHVRQYLLPGEKVKKEEEEAEGDGEVDAEIDEQVSSPGSGSKVDANVPCVHSTFGFH